MEPAALARRGGTQLNESPGFLARFKTVKARLILKYSTDAKKALEKACNESRTKRRKGGGALSHAEQDLLRAMLVFAAAGLDSILKQLIRDAIERLAPQDRDVQAALETFVSRRIRDDYAESPGSSKSGRNFLANILVSSQPLYRVTEAYIEHLTGESLQSTSQLVTAVKALGIEPSDLSIDREYVDRIFFARNQIIHEMDIDLESTGRGSRKRRSRTVDDMTNMADTLLQVGGSVIEAVEGKIAAAGGRSALRLDLPTT